MNCIICHSPMSYSFTKRFDQYGLGEVDYWRCASCEFCASKTHFEMSDARWSELNLAFHSDNNAREDNPYNRNQRYFHQATMLQLLARSGQIAAGKWLDWGCGVGSVARLLHELFGQTLLTFDRYVEPQIHAQREDQLTSCGYDLVLNTAVFEHVRSRATLDEIESYVAPHGALAVHTLVRGVIPKDESWMYLLPVHCAFHTNRSMQRLMDDWGYRCSVYNEHAKLWVMFKQPAEAVQPRVEALNRLLGWEYLHFKPGFVDYWP